MNEQQNDVNTCSNYDLTKFSRIIQTNFQSKKKDVEDKKKFNVKHLTKSWNKSDKKTALIGFNLTRKL